MESMQPTLQSTLVRWMYRILAPRHPRGWLDFHAVADATNPAVISSVHCHGMERWQLPNLEIVSVPSDLAGFAHGILFDVAGYTKSQRPIRDGETFGGILVSSNQAVPHVCSMHHVPFHGSAGAACLRVVDLGEAADAGFPKKLFAAHLLALAEKSRDSARSIGLLRRVVEIYSGETSTASSEDAAQNNPGNFFGWWALGDALCDSDNNAEGLRCLQTAAERWPHGAQQNAKNFVEAIRTGRLPPPEKDPRAKFWSDLAAQAPT